MKKVRILIITLIIILTLGCATFAVLYFATDVFKTEKELFYKYASQIELNNFINTEFYNEYSDKLKTSKYEENSKISVEISGQDLGDIKKEINIASKKDMPNKLAASEIIINNNGTNELTLEYLRNADIYGVLLKNILGQYVAVENNNLKDFAQKLGIEDASQIPDKLEMSENELITNKEINEICNKYKKLIIEKIRDECYSKVEKGQITVGNEQVEANGYEITININQLQEILKVVFEELKNDEQIYNILSRTNKEITLKEYQKSINSILDNMENIEEDNAEVLNIIVYKSGKEAKKLYIRFGNYQEKNYIDISLENVNNKPTITINIFETGLFNGDNQTSIIISKTQSTEEQETWNITIANKAEETTEPITLNITRSGTLESSIISNEIELVFEEESIGKGTIKYTSTTEINNDIEIEEFEDGEYVVINELSQEQLKNLFTNLGKLLSEKTEDESVYIFALIGVANVVMDGSPYDKVLIPSAIIGTSMSVALNGGLFEKANDAAQQTSEATQKEADLLSEITQEANDGSIEMFNVRFVVYEGLQMGSSVKTLLSMIDNSNLNYTDHIIKYDNINIDSSKKYNISLGYDDKGYVNRVIIEEQ